MLANNSLLWPIQTYSGWVIDIDAQMCDIQSLRQILIQTRTIAVVGLSDRWHRPSYFAAKYLKNHGYKIIPINPKYQSILDEPCYPDLGMVPEPIDVVNVFQRSERVPPFAADAIAIGAKVLWLQLGVTHSEAATQARSAGLEVIQDRCMKIEHGRLLGGLNYCGVNTKLISSKRPRHVV